MPGALQLPVNQNSLPRSKTRKLVISERLNNESEYNLYKVRVGVRRPEDPETVAVINYDLYDRHNQNKKYECVIDTGAPSTILPFHVKRTLQGDKGWNLNPIASLGYGEGACEIHATTEFEIQLGDRRKWTKWVQPKIAVLVQDPGNGVEYALIGNDITDQLAYAHEPQLPIKFLDGTDEEKLTELLSRCN